MVKEITVLDKLIIKKIYTFCFEIKYKNYQDIAIDLDVTESFIKQVFSFRSKFNIYHIFKLSILLDIEINNLFPSLNELNDSLEMNNSNDILDIEIIGLLNGKNK